MLDTAPDVGSVVAGAEKISERRSISLAGVGAGDEIIVGSSFSLFVSFLFACEVDPLLNMSSKFNRSSFCFEDVFGLVSNPPTISSSPIYPVDFCLFMTRKSTIGMRTSASLAAEITPSLKHSLPFIPKIESSGDDLFVLSPFIAFMRASYSQERNCNSNTCDLAFCFTNSWSLLRVTVSPEPAKRSQSFVKAVNACCFTSTVHM
mmetsp:Transcript_14236/g.26707  ORF Transcript_14236/g.26707 Transcript_14236/m.26707 type:complete len:205 (-) Transcript_14236:2170-2784(-)